jgi:hypothetical protein
MPALLQRARSEDNPAGEDSEESEWSYAIYILGIQGSNS